MTRPLLVAGGTVYDPAHGINGEVRDVLVEGGKIVECAESVVVSAHGGPEPAQIIDARGKVVMPGGIDMHAHFASSAVSAARALGIKDAADNEGTDAGGAPSLLVPDPQETGETLARLGYTTVIEAAVPPGDAGVAHQQLDQIPGVDTGILVQLADHPLLVEPLGRGDEAQAAAVAQNLLASTGAYGIKAVISGRSLGQRDPLTPVAPRQIIGFLAALAEDLRLPHPLHLHAPGLGLPGNAEILMETVRATGGRRLHLAHLQYYSYGQSEQGGFASAASQMCRFLGDHAEVTADAGVMMFGPACVVTCDADLARDLSPGRAVAEQDAGYSAVPMHWSADDPVNSLQWAVGLELLLEAEDLWQIALTIDHPNGGSFRRYPEVIALLMDRRWREETLRHVHPYALENSRLPECRREMTLSEIAILTRAGPARALGMTTKGHLGPGADGDLTIYDNLSDRRQMFSRSRWVIHAGEVVVEDGEYRGGAAGQRWRAAVEPHADGAALLARWRHERGGYDGGRADVAPTRIAKMTSAPPRPR